VALLEVVVALALFFGVAVVLLGGLTTCVRGVQQLRMTAQASDLAVTALSEVQMGLRAVADDGPTPYEEPLQDWSWQVTVTPLMMTATTTPVLDLSRVEVTIRNTARGYTQRLYDIVPTPMDMGTTAPPADAGG